MSDTNHFKDSRAMMQAAYTVLEVKKEQVDKETVNIKLYKNTGGDLEDNVGH